MGRIAKWETRWVRLFWVRAGLVTPLRATVVVLAVKYSREISRHRREIHYEERPGNSSTKRPRFLTVREASLRSGVFLAISDGKRRKRECERSARGNTEMVRHLLESGRVFPEDRNTDSHGVLTLTNSSVELTRLFLCRSMRSRVTRENGTANERRRVCTRLCW